MEFRVLLLSWIGCGCARRCLLFFQAEDGIRDASVTGVQTCALPICPCGRDGEGLRGTCCRRRCAEREPAAGTSDEWCGSSADGRLTVRRRGRLRVYGNGGAGLIPRGAGRKRRRFLPPGVWDRRRLRARSGNWHRRAARAVVCVKSVRVGSVRGAGGRRRGSSWCSTDRVAGSEATACEPAPGILDSSAIGMSCKRRVLRTDSPHTYPYARQGRQFGNVPRPDKPSAVDS